MAENMLGAAQAAAAAGALHGGDRTAELTKVVAQATVQTRERLEAIPRPAGLPAAPYWARVEAELAVMAVEIVTVVARAAQERPKDPSQDPGAGQVAE